MTQHEFVPLWSGSAPSALGKTELDTPALTIHLPNPDNFTGCGIIVAPGGGYRILCSDYEGLQVAQKLNENGIAAFVLRYRVAPTYDSSVSLLDGQRAVRLIRARAKLYGLHSLGFLGFSAGGHLAVNVGTSADSVTNRSSTDRIDQQSARPDFLVPIYAVTNGTVRGRKADEYTATNTRVDSNTPPTFLVHTHEDEIVSAEQSIIFYEALRRAGVAAELHVFNHGEHGIGLASGDPDVAVWFTMLKQWLTRRAFLTKRSRIAVNGTLLINGQVPGIAWVTFEPKNGGNTPLARVMVNRSSEGKFTIPKEKGLVPGNYRVVVSHISEKYPHDATGSYSIDESTMYEAEADIEEGCRQFIHVDDSLRLL